MHRWFVCLVAAVLLGAGCRASGDSNRGEAGQASTPASPPTSAAPSNAVERFPVPAGSAPHDVAPAPDGKVWYTAQRTGKLGLLDPATGGATEVPLGTGSAPHGVIVGPDGHAWVTDSGLNAIVRVDGKTNEVKRFPLPAGHAGANLNTAAFDKRGILWFTGQSGVYGRLDPVSGEMTVYDAPEGRGPYGITATPDGTVWYASLAGSHIARVDPVSGAATVVEPPTAEQGARRIWTDSHGPRCRLALRLRRQCSGSLRSADEGIDVVPAAEHAEQRPPDPRPARRSVGCGVGGGRPGADQDRLRERVIAPFSTKALPRAAGRGR